MFVMLSTVYWWLLYKNFLLICINFTDGIVQLPPYSPPAGVVTVDSCHHGNPSQLTTSNTTSDGHRDESPALTSGGRTKYDCKTETVSGFDN